MNNVTGILLSMVFLAAGFGYFDSRFTLFQRIYVKGRNLFTSPERKLSMEDGKSFVRGQGPKGALQSAAFLGSILIVVILFSSSETLVKIMLSAGTVLALYFGFLCSPIFGWIIDLLGSLLNKADDIQSGEIKLKDAVDSLVDDAKTVLVGDSENVPESLEPDAPIASVQPEPVIKAEPQDSDDDTSDSKEDDRQKDRDGLKSFLNKEG